MSKKSKREIAADILVAILQSAGNNKQAAEAAEAYKIILAAVKE